MKSWRRRSRFGRRWGMDFWKKCIENALAIELKRRGIAYEQQKLITVFYDGHNVGDYVADIIVEGKIVLELKSAKNIDGGHLVQTLNYLKATGLHLGLILNFGPQKMEYKRVVF